MKMSGILSPTVLKLLVTAIMLVVPFFSWVLNGAILADLWNNFIVHPLAPTVVLPTISLFIGMGLRLLARWVRPLNPAIAIYDSSSVSHHWETNDSFSTRVAQDSLRMMLYMILRPLYVLFAIRVLVFIVERMW